MLHLYHNVFLLQEHLPTNSTIVNLYIGTALRKLLQGIVIRAFVATGPYHHQRKRPALTRR